jgi:hypothetical protein
LCKDDEKSEIRPHGKQLLSKKAGDRHVLLAANEDLLKSLELSELDCSGEHGLLGTPMDWVNLAKQNFTTAQYRYDASHRTYLYDMMSRAVVYCRSVGIDGHIPREIMQNLRKRILADLEVKGMPTWAEFGQEYTAEV